MLWQNVSMLRTSNVVILFDVGNDADDDGCCKTGRRLGGGGLYRDGCRVKLIKRPLAFRIGPPTAGLVWICLGRLSVSGLTKELGLCGKGR